MDPLFYLLLGDDKLICKRRMSEAMLIWLKIQLLMQSYLSERMVVWQFFY
jgi:hypothetical protein